MNKNKALISAVIAILLVSSLAAVGSAAAFPMRSPIGSPMGSPMSSNRPISASWIRINGIITKWGTTDVRGQLQTQLRTAVLQSSDTRQLSGATAMWTTNITRAIQAAKTPENFTYVFYAARLLNASVSTVSASSSSYFLNGTWNVATVKSTVTIITNDNGEITKVLRNQDITPEKVYGELTITGNTFTLTLGTMDPLTGSVWRSVTRSWFNPFQMTDGSTSSTVTNADVKAVAQCYGAMPGWGNYDSSMDYNNNYRVDIADISTVAANM